MNALPDLPCLPLDSPRWHALHHAYGQAGDIPALLARLAALPAADDEPWSALWDALAHQDDVYPASFAAVPHVVRALAAAPAQADAIYFQFPTVVEICRQRQAIAVPADLSAAYVAALAALPGLVAAASVRAWDDDFLACALAAIAAAKGGPDIAEAVLSMTPEAAAEFMDWQDAQ